MSADLMPASLTTALLRPRDAGSTVARFDAPPEVPQLRSIPPASAPQYDVEREGICRSFNPEAGGWKADASRGPVATRYARFLLLDVSALAFAALVACAITRMSPPRLLGDEGMALATIAAGVVAMLAVLGAYRSTSAVAKHPAFLRAAVAAAFSLAALSAPTAGFVPAAALRIAMVFLAIVVVALPVLAAVYQTLLRQPHLDERIVLVGSGPLARAIAYGIAQHQHLGIRLAGYVSDAREPERNLGPRLGSTRDLDSVLREFAIDRVVIAGGPIDTATEEMLAARKLAGMPVDLGLTSFEWLYQRTPIDGAVGETLLDPASLTPGRSFESAKRALDLLLAAVGLLLLAPVLGVAAATIKLGSRGPVFYGQTRLGRGGHRFRLWKLRSMIDGAESDRGAVCAEADDARVTKVGRFLRRSRIDEVPQLWNVLQGDMSIVGPRPERPEICESLARLYPMFRYRTAVRPGVTGWAQVRQGYVNQVEGFGVKLSYDLFYLKNRSMALDLRVLWRTVGELLLLKGV
jgi:exopolysaccharide biosynthesis polyprenyl glycosylphosphotransferase